MPPRKTKSFARKNRAAPTKARHNERKRNEKQLQQSERRTQPRDRQTAGTLNGQPASQQNQSDNTMIKKIFGPRPPNKRRIKKKKLDETPLEAAGDTDSEYQTSKASDGTRPADNNEEQDEGANSDATIVSSENRQVSGREAAVDKGKEKASASDLADVEDNQAAIKDFLNKWRDNDPGLCCICLDAATLPENMLVYCDGEECEVVVHQECYGILKLPADDEPWYCDRCLAKPSEYVSCCLCPNKNGAFRRLKNGETSGSWVHVVCALWVPGMWIANSEEISEITVENIDQQNWRKPCCICLPEHANEGAVLRCDAGGCKNWVHATCAHSMTLLECADDDQQISDPYFVYCPTHGGSAGRPSLNDWEKWYRKRDVFLQTARKKEGSARTKRVVAEDDLGMSLRELFEDRYVEYRERREARIAAARRRLAETTSVIRVLNEQAEKYDNSLAELDIKIEQAQKEKSAAEVYLDDIRQAIMTVTETMWRLDGLGGAMVDVAEASNDLVDQFKAIAKGGPISWSDKAFDAAREIDVKGLDTRRFASMGIKMPEKGGVRRKKQTRKFGVRGTRGKVTPSRSTRTTPARRGRRAAVEEAHKRGQGGRGGRGGGRVGETRGRRRRMVEDEEREEEMQEDEELEEEDQDKEYQPGDQQDDEQMEEDDEEEAGDGELIDAQKDELMDEDQAELVQRNRQEEERRTEERRTEGRRKSALKDETQRQESLHNGDSSVSRVPNGSSGHSVNVNGGAADRMDVERSASDVESNAQESSPSKSASMDYAVVEHASKRRRVTRNAEKKVIEPICTVCSKLTPPDNNSSPIRRPSTKPRAEVIMGGRDSLNRMIRCTKCSRWYHLSCMNPPRTKMPAGRNYTYECERCREEEERRTRAESTSSQEGTEERTQHSQRTQTSQAVRQQAGAAGAQGEQVRPQHGPSVNAHNSRKRNRSTSVGSNGQDEQVGNRTPVTQHADGHATPLTPHTPATPRTPITPVEDGYHRNDHAHEGSSQPTPTVRPKWQLRSRRS